MPNVDMPILEAPPLTSKSTLDQQDEDFLRELTSNDSYHTYPSNQANKPQENFESFNGEIFLFSVFLLNFVRYDITKWFFDYETFISDSDFYFDIAGENSGDQTKPRQEESTDAIDDEVRDLVRDLVRDF
jgi:hypothetical protein